MHTPTDTASAQTAEAPDRSRHHGHYRVRVITDDRDPASPRQPDENLGMMVLYHRFAMLPNEGDETLNRQILDRLHDQTVHPDRAGRLAAVRQWLTDEHDASVVLGVWGYSHGGLSFRTGEDNPFTEPLDSDLAGIIWTTRALRATHGPAPDTDERVAEVLSGEVAEYDQWNNGGLFRYVVERRSPEGWTEIASEGGYYDEQGAHADGQDAIPDRDPDLAERWYRHAEHTADQLDHAGTLRLLRHLAGNLHTLSPAGSDPRADVEDVYRRFTDARAALDTVQAHHADVARLTDQDDRGALNAELATRRDDVTDTLAELARTLDDLATAGIVPLAWQAASTGGPGRP